MKDSISGFCHRLLGYSEFGALIGFVVVFLVFYALSPSQFLTIESLAAILTKSAVLGIIAIGMCFLMISGEFDLSVGSTCAVSAMCFALLMSKMGIHPAIALLIALLISGGIGFANSVITLKGGIPSFIATLGMMWFLRGVLLAITGGRTVEYWGRSTLLLVLNGRIGHFRTSSIWLIVLVIIFAIILGRTRYGNWVYATGGSRETTKVMGVNADRVKRINFVLTGLLAGFAGCVYFGRFKFVDPTLGLGWELEAIAAAVIGGTLLTGGRGSVIGACIGALLVGMISHGLILAGAPAYWYQAFIGLILIVAAIINMQIQKRGFI